MTELPVVVSSDSVTVAGFASVVDLSVDVGARGTRGSILFSGSGVPPAVPPGNDEIFNGINQFRVGDLYINTAPGSYGDVYQYRDETGGAAWSKIMNMNMTLETNPPSASTDNAIVRWDGTLAETVQNSGVTISDTDDILIPGDLDVTGATTMEGSLTVTGNDIFINRNGDADDAYIRLRSDAGENSAIRHEVGTNLRWMVGKDNATAESGSDVGSNYTVQRFSDGGSYIGSALEIERATGDATFEADVTVDGALTIGDTTLDSDTAGYLNTDQGYRTTSDILVPSGAVRLGSGLSAGIETGTYSTHTRIRGGIVELGTGGPTISTGLGSPEGVVTAPVGSRYTREDGDTLGDIEYVKMSGTGNTGWVPGPACDTGIRDLSGESLLNGWTTTQFSLRRVGQTVTLAGKFTGASATGDTPYTLPTGFDNGLPGTDALNFLATYSVSGDSRFAQVNGLRSIRIYSYGAGDHYVTVTYQTEDAWPTSLPGISG